jgi:hypothetical protein
MPAYASPTFTATYQGLCDKIADTLNRADLTAAIPDFTVLATAKIERDISRARHPSAISTTTLTANSIMTNLPADFVSVYQLMLTNAGKQFHYVSPEDVKFLFEEKATSDATDKYYTIIGNKLRILPAPSASETVSLDLYYYARLAALNTTNTTNWVLTRYPDLYLYGALSHSAPYLKNDERIALWDGIYSRILSEIEVEADRANRPQSVLNARSRGF